MFGLFSKDHKTLKIKLSSENNTRLIRLRGLYTYQRSEEVSNSDVISELLERVEKQTIEEQEKLAENGKKHIGKFIMLVGLPGAGKSTYASELAADDPDAVIISKKDIECEYNLSKDIATEVMNARSIELLRQGKTVIYDDCDMNPYSRKEKLRFVSAVKCEKKCVVLNTPLSICEEHALVAEYYKEKRSYYPSYNEGWNEIIVFTRNMRNEKEVKVLKKGQDIPWDLSNEHVPKIDSRQPILEETMPKSNDSRNNLEETSKLSILDEDTSEEFNTDLTEFFQRR